MGPREAIHNIFMMTSNAIKRFGLWDENIYPAFCEGEPVVPTTAGMRLNKLK
jgi:hypothetical protein